MSPSASPPREPTGGGSYRSDAETETLVVAHALRADGFDASEDGTGRGTPLVPVAFHMTQDPIHGDVAPAMGQGNSQGRASLGVVIAPCLRSNAYNNSDPTMEAQMLVAYPIQEANARQSKDQHGPGIGIASPDEPMYTLQAGAQHGVALTAPGDAYKCGTCAWVGRLTEHTDKCPRCEATGPSGIENVMIRPTIGPDAGKVFDFSTQAFSCKDHGADCGDDIAPTLRSMEFDQSHANGGGQVAVAFSCKDHGADAGELAPTLRAMEHDESHANGGGQVAVAFQESQSGCREYGEAGSLRAHGPGHDPVGTRVREGSMVRRLTPTECERLQGFPDGWTAITYRGKPAADGPRYRALGNSIAVPCLAWLGRRLEIVDAALRG